MFLLTVAMNMKINSFTLKELLRTYEGHKMHAQPTETEPELGSERLLWCTGQQWLAAGQGLWVQQTSIELPEITQDLRNRLLKAQTELCAQQDPEKGAVNPKTD